MCKERADYTGGVRLQCPFRLERAGAGRRGLEDGRASQESRCGECPGGDPCEVPRAKLFLRQPVLEAGQPCWVCAVSMFSEPGGPQFPHL